MKRTGRTLVLGCLLLLQPLLAHAQAEQQAQQMNVEHARRAMQPDLEAFVQA